MLTGKQRSYLKSLANTLKSLAQLGKEGVSDAFVAQMDDLFEHHELVKVTVLDNSLNDAREAAIEVAERTDAEFVQAIGNKFTLYRQSRTNPLMEIPGADNTRVKNNLLKKKQEEDIKKKKVMNLSKTGKTISKPNAKRKARQKSSKKEH